jgi:hypothetical protein
MVEQASHHSTPSSACILPLFADISFLEADLEAELGYFPNSVLFDIVLIGGVSIPE